VLHSLAYELFPDLKGIQAPRDNQPATLLQT